MIQSKQEPIKKVLTRKRKAIKRESGKKNGAPITFQVVYTTRVCDAVHCAFKQRVTLEYIVLRSLASPKRSERGRRNAANDKAKPSNNAGIKDKRSDTGGGAHVRKSNIEKHPSETRKRQKMAVRGGCIFLVKVLLFIFNFILWVSKNYPTKRYRIIFINLCSLLSSYYHR